MCCTHSEARTWTIACCAAVWRAHLATAVRSLWALGSRHDLSSSQMTSPSSVFSFSHAGVGAVSADGETAFCNSWKRRAQTRSPNLLASVDNAAAAGDHSGRKFTFSWAVRGSDELRSASMMKKRTNQPTRTNIRCDIISVLHRERQPSYPQHALPNALHIYRDLFGLERLFGQLDGAL